MSLYISSTVFIWCLILRFLSLNTKVHNVEFALELLQDAGLGKPKAKAQGMFTF